MKKKNRIKNVLLPDPETYTYSEFKSINGCVTRKYNYNKGSRSDAFGRTTDKELWSNPYNAWTKYNTSGLMPFGFTPSSYQTIRNYNSISYNYLKDSNTNHNKSNRKKVIPKDTISSSHLLYINKKVEESKYYNHLINLNKRRQILNDQLFNAQILNDSQNVRQFLKQNSIIDNPNFSPSFYYSSPTKFTRDYFGSTLYKGTTSSSLSIADLEKNVSSQYWIKKSALPNAQGSGIKVYNGFIPNGVSLKDWYKYYPTLPFDYYNYSFL